MAEAEHLKCLQCGFKSHLRHMDKRTIEIVTEVALIIKEHTENDDEYKAMQIYLRLKELGVLNEQGQA